MIRLLEDNLKPFRSCFSREAAFKWFVIIVIAFMQRSDFLGITSVIRDLLLDGNCYESMLHFFYSDAWSLDVLRKKWYAIVSKSNLTLKVHDFTVLAGDGVKVSKEAKYMPGIKRMNQESEDSSKGQFIWGHMFGAIGVILGKQGKLCLPLKINIQDGIQSTANWENSTISCQSHVVQMVENGFDTAKVFGKSILLLDRYFLTVPALKRLNELNKQNDDLLRIVTKAKTNCVAYKKPSSDAAPRRGRPSVKGTPVKLKDYWENSSNFTDGIAHMYGKDQKISYFCTDLLWGQNLYQELRFVLVIYNGMRSILVSTDLSLSPVEIIELYALRFKIEKCFREFKQQFSGFGYHFWSLHLDKRNRFKRKDDPYPIDKVSDPKSRQLILKKIRAIEAFVFTCTVAMGLVQIVSLKQTFDDNIQNVRYTRTTSVNRLSEGAVINYFHKSFFGLLLHNPDSFITRFIREKQKTDERSNEVA